MALRDTINATIGFEELSRVFDKSSKSLMRMFGPKGKPPDDQSVCGDRLPAGAGRHTLVSESSESDLECCVTAFCRQFLRAINDKY